MFPLNWNIPFIRKNGSRTTLGAITGDIAGIENDIAGIEDDIAGIEEEGTTKVIENAITSTVGNFSLNKLIKKNGIMIASFQLELNSDVSGYTTIMTIPNDYETPAVVTAVGYRYTNNTDSLAPFTLNGTSIQPIIRLSSGDIIRGSITWAIK